jgi:hypothetical protein
MAADALWPKCPEKGKVCEVGASDKGTNSRMYIEEDEVCGRHLWNDKGHGCTRTVHTVAKRPD